MEVICLVVSYISYAYFLHLSFFIFTISFTHCPNKVSDVLSYINILCLCLKNVFTTVLFAVYSFLFHFKRTAHPLSSCEHFSFFIFWPTAFFLKLINSWVLPNYFESRVFIYSVVKDMHIIYLFSIRLSCNTFIFYFEYMDSYPFK